MISSRRVIVELSEIEARVLLEILPGALVTLKDQPDKRAALVRSRNKLTTILDALGRR